MALGMVTLGQGGNVDGHLYKGLSDLRLEDRLHQYMVGGSHVSTTGSSEEHWMRSDNRYSFDQNGIHCYRNTVGGGRRSNGGHGSALDGTFHSVDMSDPISNGGGTTGADQKDRDGDGSGTSSCSRIYEGPQVNVDVTR